MHTGEIPSVLCLAGPTGTGKSRIALQVASEFGCEIINADSRQVYRDFPVITAQPEAAERAICAHHLYGYLPVSARISAGQWLEAVIPLCRSIRAKGRTPLLVGGTGFYFEALFSGFSEIPPVPAAISSNLEERISSEGSASLHSELKGIDPVFAARIHSNDRQRIQRGLEVWLATGKPLSWWHEHDRPRPCATGPLLVLGTELADLKPALESRIERMLANGALQEAEAAWAACPDERASGWSGIGCAELLAVIRGRTDLAEARKLWLANTRAYAKRQLTWFRARKNAIWLTAANAENALKKWAATLA